MSGVEVGVIGGSGLYQMEGVKVLDEVFVETPFGKTSDQILLGELDGVKIAFLPRHGRGHLLSPSEINFRANIFALKTLGVENILSVSAVGSMKEEIKPGDIVLVDQFIDRTVRRTPTFFENGIVAHVSFADPVCNRLQKLLVKTAQKEGIRFQSGGTYLCIEGPMFSTRAESKLYRSWGVDVIGMTNLQEAKLAREAEICYTTIALATDYDCWHMTQEPVDVAQVLEIMQSNVETAKLLIRKTLPLLSKSRDCSCPEALKNAIMTSRDKIGPAVRKRLAPIVGKYC